MSGAERSGWDFSVSVPWLSAHPSRCPACCRRCIRISALFSRLGSGGVLGCSVKPFLAQASRVRVAVRPPRLLPNGECFPGYFPFSRVRGLWLLLTGVPEP